MGIASSLSTIVPKAVLGAKGPTLSSTSPAVAWWNGRDRRSPQRGHLRRALPASPPHAEDIVIGLTSPLGVEGRAKPELRQWAGPPLPYAGRDPHLPIVHTAKGVAGTTLEDTERLSTLSALFDRRPHWHETNINDASFSGGVVVESLDWP